MLKNINFIKAALFTALALAGCIAFMTIEVDMNFLGFVMSLRVPKLLSMILASFCIGYGSIIFQSIINNRIVTPCLLGMNALYIVVHTSLAFIFGATSAILANKNLAFIIDISIMGLVATLMYSYLFRLTKYNILYILLAGTVLATFFTSISNTMIRMLDPNEYDVLLSSLVAGFDHVNADILIMATLLIIGTLVYARKELPLLDIITLGRNQAINLGVDYENTIKRLMLVVVFFITIATALVGPISFLGLIIANISRELFKTFKHSYLMYGSFIAGLAVLSIGQTLIEHVFSFGVIISVFIQLFGGAYFLYLILRSKRV